MSAASPIIRILILAVFAACSWLSGLAQLEATEVVIHDRHIKRLKAADNFTVTAVHDSRKDSSLGLIFNLQAETQRPIILPPDSSDLLLSLLKKLNKSFEPKLNVEVVIHKFYLAEIIAPSGSYGSLTLCLSFVKRDGNRITELYQHSSSAPYRLDESRSDVLVQRVARAYEDFKLRLETDHLSKRSFTSMEEVRPRTLPRGQLKAGFYASFSDYLDQLPLDSLALEPNYYTKTDQEKGQSIEYVMLSQRLPNELRDIYGFSDGSTLFIKAKSRDRFYPVVEKSDLLFFRGPLDFVPARGYNGGYIPYGFAGDPAMLALGIAGMLIGAGIDAAQSRGFQWYHIDPVSGTVFPKSILDTQHGTASVHVVGSSFLSKHQTLTVTVNDEPLCTLRKGEYYITKLPVKKGIHNICVADEAGERACFSLRLLDTNPVVIEATSKGRNAYQLRRLELADRNRMLRDISFGKLDPVNAP